MNLQLDVERLLMAHKAVRAELLAERNPAGYWVGHLASSPPATAAAVSALVSAHHRDSGDTLRQILAGDGQVIEQLVQFDLSEFLVESVQWLARHQNPDGGWGDCETARSNIGATMLVQAAFRLTGIPAKYADLMVRADQYVAGQGGVAGLWQRFGNDKAMVASILANCALAGMVPWRQVPTLPFEWVCLPKRWQHHVQMPVARYATPLLIAVGHAKFHHDPPRNPIVRLVRRTARAKSLAILERLQAECDGVLASAPLTAFVVMSLASSGCQDHPIVRRGVEFLLSLVRGDASWPIESNRALSVTTLALNNLATERPTAARPSIRDNLSPDTEDYQQLFNDRCLDWILECQRSDASPMTEVRAGGWSWSDLPGALANTGDSARALITLAHWRQRDVAMKLERVERAASRGIAWLLELQNDDGGWPTFYRDGGSLPFDDSGTDVTASALRALVAWSDIWQRDRPRNSTALKSPDTAERIRLAIDRGWRFLESEQREDGSFIPLWFGNEHQPGEHNPVYGTAQVLLTCADLERLETELASRAARWLVSAQHSGGGWGPPRAPLDYSAAAKDGFRAWRANEGMAKLCSVEETALAVTALLPLIDSNAAVFQAVSAGLAWLAGAVEQDAHRRPAVIGFYLPRIWYHERLYPLVFAAGALSRAIRELAPQPHETAPVG